MFLTIYFKLIEIDKKLLFWYFFYLSFNKLTLIYSSSVILYPNLKSCDKISVMDLIPLACTDKIEVMKPA